MKQFSFYITIVLVYANIVSASAQKLTLEECHTKAEHHYPAIAQYDIIEQSKEFDIKNANMAYLPQLSLGAQATWQSDITKLDINLDLPIEIPDLKIPVPDKDQYRVTAEINQLIWDGGMIGAQKRTSIADAKVRKHKLESDIYTLRERINNLYFGIILLDERLHLQNLLDKELERNYERVQSYITNGVANEADLSSVKVEQLKSKQDRVEMESSRKAYIKMLSLFIGEDLTDGSTLVKPIDEGMNRISIQRPELRVFEAQEELINSQREVLTSKNMPIIGAFAQGGYGKPGLDMFNNKFKTYFVGGVRLSWNFGNLYTYSNDKRKIDLQQALLETNRETFLHNLNTVIPQQQIEIEKYREQMKDDNEIISLRTLIRQAAEAKVENGTMSVSDMLKEVTAEEAAKQAKVLHEIQYLMSIYKLKYTTN